MLEWRRESRDVSPRLRFFRQYRRQSARSKTVGYFRRRVEFESAAWRYTNMRRIKARFRGDRTRRKYTVCSFFSYAPSALPLSLSFSSLSRDPRRLTFFFSFSLPLSFSSITIYSFHFASGKQHEVVAEWLEEPGSRLRETSPPSLETFLSYTSFGFAFARTR